MQPIRIWPLGLSVLFDLYSLLKYPPEWQHTTTIPRIISNLSVTSSILIGLGLSATRHPSKEKRMNPGPHHRRVTNSGPYVPHPLRNDSSSSPFSVWEPYLTSSISPSSESLCPPYQPKSNALDDVGWYGSTYLLGLTALQLVFGVIYMFFDPKIHLPLLRAGLRGRLRHLCFCIPFFRVHLESRGSASRCAMHRRTVSPDKNSDRCTSVSS